MRPSPSFSSRSTTRRFVGKGDRCNGGWLYSSLFHEIHNTGHQRFRLSRARTGNHSDRRLRCRYGHTLFLVQLRHKITVPGRKKLLGELGFLFRRFLHGRNRARLRILFPRLGPEKAKLAGQPVDLLLVQKADFSILPVIARNPFHFAAAHTTDSFRHTGACRFLNIGQRGFPQNIEFRSQLPQKRLILRRYPDTGR